MPSAPLDKPRLPGANLFWELPIPTPVIDRTLVEALPSFGPRSRPQPLGGCSGPCSPMPGGLGTGAPGALHVEGVRPPEHGDQQVHEQYVGDQQEGDQQEDDQPVGVEVRAGGGVLLQQGVQGAVHTGF